jgi:hypothetical protein
LRLLRWRRYETTIVAQRQERAIALPQALSRHIGQTRASILHASQAADQPARRRVLQIDYAATDLPGGLTWLGV